MSNDIPRRNRIDQMSAAELAILRATEAVEALPADLRLTQAVNLLTMARAKVADVVDGVNPVLDGAVPGLGASAYPHSAAYPHAATTKKEGE